MASPKTFEKLLDVREKEKQEAQKAYKQSVEDFEVVASDMYHLLKQKEDAEQAYHNDIHRSATVTTLSSHFSYIEKLKQKINQLQVSVNQARNLMDDRQGKLTDAYIEAKKFEKMIEVKKAKLHAAIKSEEDKQMDEISVTQFINNREW
ncbi:flagellar export protein FliJ [Sediminibacillus albus]|uniref:Flagellar FliJ protein n=1 Tax=Sediminibacillus albus TaxID=407036 RepID=A0A1G8W2C8_9BACI|nr:flagellar export protein FliJ [Sediminibacillus albus]SDJ72419.1 flagellar FliJ protein [Sediminibacillus albus]